MKQIFGCILWPMSRQPLTFLNVLWVFNVYIKFLSLSTAKVLALCRTERLLWLKLVMFFKSLCFLLIKCLLLPFTLYDFDLNLTVKRRGNLCHQGPTLECLHKTSASHVSSFHLRPAMVVMAMPVSHLNLNNDIKKLTKNTEFDTIWFDKVLKN